MRRFANSASLARTVDRSRVRQIPWSFLLTPSVVLTFLLREASEARDPSRTPSMDGEHLGGVEHHAAHCRGGVLVGHVLGPRLYWIRRQVLRHGRQGSEPKMLPVASTSTVKRKRPRSAVSSESAPSILPTGRTRISITGSKPVLLFALALGFVIHCSPDWAAGCSLVGIICV